MIVLIKRDAKNTSIRMQGAVANYKCIESTFPDDDKGMDDKTLRDLRICAMSLATIGRELSCQVQQILELEADAEDLGNKIMDDSNLPNFAKLDEGRDALQENTACVDLPLEPMDTLGGETVPEDARPKPFCDERPLLWGSYYENEDKVVSPSADGARAMVAMRIRKTLKDDQIQVWRIDEHGNRIVDFAKAG